MSVHLCRIIQLPFAWGEGRFPEFVAGGVEDNSNVVFVRDPGDMPVVMSVKGR